MPTRGRTRCSVGVLDRASLRLDVRASPLRAQAFFAGQGAETMVTTPEAFQKILEEDVVKWGKAVKASGAKID